MSGRAEPPGSAVWARARMDVVAIRIAAAASHASAITMLSRVNDTVCLPVDALVWKRWCCHAVTPVFRLRYF